MSVSSKELQSLNKMMALAVGSDPGLVRELSAAIEFIEKNSGPTEPAYRSLTRCAHNLLHLHLHGARCGFSHCDLRRDAFDPLWIRSKVLGSLRHLAHRRNAVILISGLRRVLCPPGRYWTKRVQRDYLEMQGMIEALCARYAPRRMNLRLIFL